MLVVFCVWNISLFASPHSIFWSKSSKGGVTVGVAHMKEFPGNGAIAIFAIGSTNYTKWMVLPIKMEERLGFNLRGTNSQSVEMTDLGKKFGMQPRMDISRHERISHELEFLRDQPQQIGFFYIDQCFIIKSPGEYELEVRPQLLKEDGKKPESENPPESVRDLFKRNDVILKPVIFDPIRIKLRLSGNSSIEVSPKSDSSE